MKEINFKYQNIISECKFISKPNTWFVEGKEVELGGGYNFRDYQQGDKFNAGYSLFDGLTNESFDGYKGNLPRQDSESCSFDEFLIYDEFGNEISELTIEEYETLIKSK